MEGQSIPPTLDAAQTSKFPDQNKLYEDLNFEISESTTPTLETAVDDKFPDQNKNYYEDPNYVVSPESIKIKENASYVASGIHIDQNKCHYEDPNYVASPESIQISENASYVASGSYTLRELTNINSLPSNPLKTEKTTTVSKAERSGNCQRVILAICGVIALMMTAVIASTALCLIILAPSSNPACNCTNSYNTNTMGNTTDSMLITDSMLTRFVTDSMLTRFLDSLESKINQTNSKIEASQNEFEMKHNRLLEKINAVSSSHLGSSWQGNDSLLFTSLLQNCTSRIESQCTVEPSVGRCMTANVVEQQPGSIAVDFQCIRMESVEQNPLVATLDVANEGAICLCYVVETEGRERTNAVVCGVRVTRCSLIDFHREN